MAVLKAGIRSCARTILARLGRLEDAERVIQALEHPVDRRSRLDEAHMRVILAAVLAEDSNCVDVGAHDGRILREMVRCAPLGRHFAFEPLPHLYPILRAGFPGVEVRDLALADEAGTSSFRFVRGAPEYSGLRKREYFRVAHPDVQLLKVRVARLDDELPEAYRPALIKIDVEGGELGVLRGARRTLTHYRPVIIFEHAAGAREAFGTTPDEIWKFLVDDFGFRVFDLDGDGPYTLRRFQEDSSSRRSNFLARP
jgi:FkbM family methyltransferase